MDSSLRPTFTNSALQLTWVKIGRRHHTLSMIRKATDLLWIMWTMTLFLDKEAFLNFRFYFPATKALICFRAKQSTLNDLFDGSSYLPPEEGRARHPLLPHKPHTSTAVGEWYSGVPQCPGPSGRHSLQGPIKALPANWTYYSWTANRDVH